MLNDQDVTRWLDENQISATLVYPAAPTPTVAAAASAVGVSTEQIIKSVLFTIDQQNLLVITNGKSTIDRRLIAERFQVGRKRVKLATAEHVENITGYSVGGVPPFAHISKLTTWIDPKVLEQDVVYAGGGSSNALIRIETRVLISATDATITPVSRSSDANEHDH
ncbi:MAG: YbaK/EbsC family protein [Chloroflexota bacterium]